MCWGARDAYHALAEMGSGGFEVFETSRAMANGFSHNRRGNEGGPMHRRDDDTFAAVHGWVVGLPVAGDGTGKAFRADPGSSRCE
jgi:hypothetical protein